MVDLSSQFSKPIDQVRQWAELQRVEGIDHSIPGAATINVSGRSLAVPSLVNMDADGSDPQAHVSWVGSNIGRSQVIQPFHDISSETEVPDQHGRIHKVKFSVDPLTGSSKHLFVPDQNMPDLENSADVDAYDHGDGEPYYEDPILYHDGSADPGRVPSGTTVTNDPDEYLERISAAMATPGRLFPSVASGNVGRHIAARRYTQNPAVSVSVTGRHMNWNRETDSVLPGMNW